MINGSGGYQHPVTLYTRWPACCNIRISSATEINECCPGSEPNPGHWTLDHMPERRRDQLRQLEIWDGDASRNLERMNRQITWQL